MSSRVPTAAPNTTPVPCRYCDAPETTVIDRRADRVLRHCASCRLTWTADADLAADTAAVAGHGVANSELRTKN